jgi:hypothetical protein
MNSRKPISLNQLSLNHRDELARMLAGIRGDADATLWTAQMRAAIRGGKCKMIGVASDQSDSE